MLDCLQEKMVTMGIRKFGPIVYMTKDIVTKS